MAGAPVRQSYASMVGSGHDNREKTKKNAASSQQASSRSAAQPQHGHNDHRTQPRTNDHQQHQRAPSPTHVPRTSAPESEVYVLTFLTDSKHHETLNGMRKKYFPPKLNKLDAHLTLFHALPGSKLEDEILPALQEVAHSASKFQLLASSPFKLRKGIAIGVPKSHGGDDARNVHTQLKSRWHDFLSDQDAGGFAAHYTIMNKVDDSKQVDQAFQDVEDQWRPCRGTVEGLSLWRYDRGYWQWQQNFGFNQS